MKSRVRVFAALVCASAFAGGGCQTLSTLPRDPDKWSERVRTSGVLPVGIAQTGNAQAEDGPEFARIGRRERRIAEAVARHLGARVEWREGSALPLLARLQERQLPLVLGLVPEKTPYKKEVALSRPYISSGPGNAAYCVAVAPGENSLLLLVDRVIGEERASWEPEPGGKP